MKDSGSAITQVLHGSPAGQSGLASGDRPIGVNGFRFTTKALRWAASQPASVTLEVARGHQLRTFCVAAAQRRTVESARWRGSEKQAQRIREWLGVPDFAPSSGDVVELAFHENFHGVEEFYEPLRSYEIVRGFSHG